MTIDFSEINEETTLKIEHYINKYSPNGNINDILAEALELLEKEKQQREYISKLLEPGLEDYEKGRFNIYGSAEELKKQIIKRHNDPKNG